MFYVTRLGVVSSVRVAAAKLVAIHVSETFHVQTRLQSHSLLGEVRRVAHLYSGSSLPSSVTGSIDYNGRVTTPPARERARGICHA